MWWLGGDPDQAADGAWLGVSGDDMISVLSLVVAILAVIVGPLVAWTVAQRQIAVTAREAWMREFREHTAALLDIHNSLFLQRRSTPLTEDDGVLGAERAAKRRAEIIQSMGRPYLTIRLSLAERGSEHDGFVQTLETFMKTRGSRDIAPGFTQAATDVLLRDRAEIATITLWRALA
jgi:hypothetical protein